MILDAGVLVAIDRDEPDVKGFIQTAQLQSEPLRTTAPVVAQVWRDGSRQARLSRFLPSLDVQPFTAAQVSLVGSLLRHSGESDVVDAHVLACAIRLDDTVITSDLDDFARLTAHLGEAEPRARHWR
ncbi:type II toxin-antitoxin system VapC family toxin [Candidatus Poriferisodalis sp.]|uniref:type II toxin-antitoxin system VapC family toxin n=1 Tax=Candidatus Poriferisodalis sp. TaxID=3101277 RepID=UPI003B0152E5